MEPPHGGGGGGRKKSKAEAGSAVAAIGDDAVGEIFLRLPDMASLARAALACKRWRRVASDRALLRSFHALHPRPPLLGVILSERGEMPVPCRCPDLLFLRVPSRDPHLAAAARAGDFPFYDIPDPASGAPGRVSRREPWMLRGCDGGRLLLSRGRWENEVLAVYDPFARAAVFFRVLGFFDHIVNYALLADDADASFQVVAAHFFGGRVDAAVFSSGTRRLSRLPSHGVGYPWNARDGARAGRFAFWQSNVRKQYHFNHRERILVLDMSAMEWSLSEVPFPVGESYCAADMAEHGGLCLVGGVEQCLQIWARSGGAWVLKQQVPLLKQFGSLKKIGREELLGTGRPPPTPSRRLMGREEESAQ
ncbi:hypothetical protein ACP4OV_019323 [Aristida adscensionis]